MSKRVNTHRSPGLAERKHQFVRVEASAAVLALVLERGYERVTVDDMVEVTGLSRRTFFRYFKSKDDVLFVAMDQFGAQIAESVGARPADEPIWDALAQGIIGVTKSTNDDGSKRLSRVLFETPALRARHLDKQERWQDLIAEQVARRLGIKANSGTARLLPALALAALDTALKEWHRSNRPLPTLVKEAFEMARPALKEARGTTPLHSKN